MDNNELIKIAQERAKAIRPEVEKLEESIQKMIDEFGEKNKCLAMIVVPINEYKEIGLKAAQFKINSLRFSCNLLKCYIFF